MGIVERKLLYFDSNYVIFFLQGAIDSESYSNAAACTHDHMCAYF